ncbi:hypothetical protein [Oceanobacillus kimchii]|uniref:hypothetical protein n=1 Tax=Oceanobacillus kimchii TaxID=746691 RepID=UPI003B0188C3
MQKKQLLIFIFVFGLTLTTGCMRDMWLDITVFVGTKREKRKVFSYNYLNEQHEKIVKIIRMVVIVLAPITLQPIINIRWLRLHFGQQLLLLAFY